MRSSASQSVRHFLPGTLDESLLTLCRSSTSRTFKISSTGWNLHFKISISYFMLIMLAVGINSKDHNRIIAWPQSKILFHTQVCLSRMKTVPYK